MVSFPDVLTAEMLSGFRTTDRGCTHPRVGEIGGVRYIAKCGSWSSYSSDAHVHNELVADQFLREIGLNVPASREYRVDFGDGLGLQTVRLAKFIEARPLLEAFHKANPSLRAKIRVQAIAAYPAQAFIAGIDTFTYDNVLVDANGALWFVDNGASFDYRACGKKKGWYWSRFDPSDARTGYLSLVQHPDQRVLQAILGEGCTANLISMARACGFTEWGSRLPSEYQQPSLIAYAKKLLAFANLPK